MKIRFRQSGGVAGLAKVAEVDSGKLPGEELARLRRMVEAALAQAIPESPHALPDEELCYVEIEVEHHRQSILVGRSSIPGPLRPLIEYLEEIAEYEKR